MSTAVRNTLRLEDQLCFLVYRLHRGITEQYRSALRGLGLTYPQFLVMLVMWESESLTVGQIGSRLHLDNGTLSPLLKRLELSGLIERSRSALDERSVVITLTPDGRGLRAQVQRATAGMDNCLADDDASARELHAQLSSLVSRVDSANER